MPQVKWDTTQRFVCGYLGEPRGGEYFCKFCSLVFKPPPPPATLPSPGYHALAWLSCTRLVIMHSPAVFFSWLPTLWRHVFPRLPYVPWLSCPPLATIPSHGYRLLLWLPCHILATTPSSCRLAIPFQAAIPFRVSGYNALPWLSCPPLNTESSPCTMPFPGYRVSFPSLATKLSIG